MARVFGWDVIRAVAILLVMWSHSLLFLKDCAWSQYLHYKPFDGVDLFFVLSGFLIGGLMLKEIKSPEEFTFRNGMIFICRRWFRTIPAYWMILLILVVLSRAIPGLYQSETDWLSYFFFYQNLNRPLIGFFWESWSLAVEEWFYLLWPIAVFLLSKFLKPISAYILATLAMGTYSIVLRHLAFNPNLDDFWFDVSVRKIVLMRWDGLACGLLLAYIMQFQISRARRLFSFVVGAVVLLTLSCMDIPNQSYFKQVFSFAVTGIGMALLFPYLGLWKTSSLWLKKSITYISKISYGLYLVNLTLVAGLLDWAKWHAVFSQAWICFILFWLVSFILAAGLYEWLERPILKWRDKNLIDRGAKL